jgi:hypothetical protein
MEAFSYVLMTALKFVAKVDVPVSPHMVLTESYPSLKKQILKVQIEALKQVVMVELSTSWRCNIICALLLVG